MIDPRDLPDVEALRAVLSYDPASGAIRWRRSKRGDRVGQIAGYNDNRGRRMIHVLNKGLMALRVAYALHYGTWPAKRITPANGDHQDLSLSNLQQVSSSVLSRQRKRRDTKLEPGITATRHGTFMSHASVGGVRSYLGTFQTFTAAMSARAAFIEVNG